MPQLLSTIRPAPGGDGPFYVVTENDGAVTNVTTGIGTISGALDQVKSDQGSIISGGGLTVGKVEIRTTAG